MVKSRSKWIQVGKINVYLDKIINAFKASKTRDQWT